MIKDGKIWVANTAEGQSLCLLPGMANRHGLVAGATGTGKTVTLKVMAESFSDMGVPVFMADVKGDIAGLSKAGTDSEDMQERIRRFGLSDSFSYKGYPVTIFDIFGEKGIPLRTTISEMGPLLLARILQLNDLQSDILSIVFRIADENSLLLLDTKDLKAMLQHVSDNRSTYEAEYGKMSPASVSAILRAVVALETAGGDRFFGEPGFNIQDLLSLGDDGRGRITVLDSESLIHDGRLYSTFLLWLLSELFESMPEVGDLEKPKLVFFFDEAHLLFSDASKALLEKIEQVVKLIRSKGIGIYFCTQNPSDIPNGVLAQLGNKVQHALRAYTPAEQKVVKAAAQSYRENPAFDTYETLLSLGTGEAIVSFLDEGGVPGVCEKAFVLPPQSAFGGISDMDRETMVKGSPFYSRYAESVDPDSAYEFLQRKGLEEAAAKEQAALEAAEAKEREKAEKEALKEQEKLAKAEERKKKQAAKAVGSSVTGTIGREVGKTIGGTFGGKFGKTLGGNVGASLGRGLFGNLFK